MLLRRWNRLLLLSWWCFFKIKKESKAVLHFIRTDRLSLFSTLLKSRQTVPLIYEHNTGLIMFVRCPYKTSPHKTSPHKTSPHKTSPHKRSPVIKRHPIKRHLAQNVTSTKRHQKTSPVTKRHLIVAVSTMGNNTSPDIIAVGTMSCVTYTAVQW